MNNTNYTDDYKFASLCDAILAAAKHDEAYCMCDTCHTKRILSVENTIATMVDAPKKKATPALDWARNIEVTRVTRVRGG